MLKFKSIKSNSPILFSFHLFFLWSEFDKIYVETATCFVVSYFFEKKAKTKRTDWVQCIFANAFLLCVDESASESVGSSEILRKEGREKHGQTPHRGQRVVVFQHGHRVPGVPHRGLPPIRDPSSLQSHAAEPVVHVCFAFWGVALCLHVPSRTGTGCNASAAYFSGCQRAVRIGAGGRTCRKNSNFLPIYWGSFVPPGLRETNAVSFANAATDVTVNANAYVSEKTAAQTLANSFSEAGLAENNKDTTATENVTAMSAYNFAGINLETVADEAEDSEFFAETFSATVLLMQTLPKIMKKI